MDASDTPTVRNISANQVSLDEQTRFAVLVSWGHLKYVQNVVMVTNPDNELPTCVGCSGCGIQIGQLVQFVPALPTAVTLSIATAADTAILDLKAINISPTDFKDHTDPEVNVSNKRLGFEEGVNMVVTPVMWPLPPTYIAPHGFDVTKDYRVPPPSESTNGEWKDTIPMCRIMQHQVNFLQRHSCQAIGNTLFHTSNWTDKETGQVATNACGRDLVISHYGRLTLVDNVSEPLIEEKIWRTRQSEVASFTTNTAPEAPAAGAETETATESTDRFVMFAKTLVDKVVKTNDSIEKEEKREKRKEIKWKYRLLGSTLVQGVHGTACKPGVLSYEFNKLLDRAWLTDATELLKEGIAGKMRSLKQDIDEVSFSTSFQTEIINQAFAVNMKNCIWQIDAIEDYEVGTMD